MENEFVAYIDEAGCSGAKFGAGSSEFLAMAAIIFRREYLPEALSTFNEARAQRGNNGKRFRKFSKSSDKDNFVLTNILSQKPVKFCFIAFHKPSLAGTNIRSNHGNEYNYLTKFLIERVSWTVRDAEVRAGNKVCDIILSEQSMYPLSDLHDYFHKLRVRTH